MVPEDAAVLSEHATAGIVVAKVDRPVELEPVLRNPALKNRDTIVTIETPRSLLGALDFADHPGVTGLCLGGEDLAMNMGLERTVEASEFQVPRFMLVAAARAAQVWSLDVICPDFRDLSVVRREARAAKAMGFDGKFAIHPAQIEHIRAAFLPDEEEIAHARRVVDAYDEAVSDGRGAVAVDGQMIDPPVAERFRRILDRWSG